MQELRDAGYLPAAVRNYLALLGWGTDDDTTLMSTEELVRRFRVEDVGKAAAIFDEKKLRWLNGRFMREMPLDEYTAAVARHLGREPDERLRAACEIAQEKAQTLDGGLAADPLPLRAPGRRPEGVGEGDEGRQPARCWRPRRRRWPAAEPFEPDAIEAALAPLLERFEVKPGKLYQPIRVAITGTSVSPGIFESLAVLGREQALNRLENGDRAACGRQNGRMILTYRRRYRKYFRLNQTSSSADVERDGEPRPPPSSSHPGQRQGRRARRLRRHAMAAARAAPPRPAAASPRPSRRSSASRS